MSGFDGIELARSSLDQLLREVLNSKYRGFVLTLDVVWCLLDFFPAVSVEFKDFRSCNEGLEVGNWRFHIMNETQLRNNAIQLFWNTINEETNQILLRHL